MTIPPKRLSAMRWILPIMLAAWGAAGHAVGLGQLQLQSWLGQPLQAVVPLLGESPDSLAGLCVKARLESAEGDFVAPLQTVLQQDAQSARLKLSSPESVREPAIAISVTIGCGMPVHRSYQVLLDPPLAAPVAAAPEPARSEPVAAKPKSESPVIAAPVARSAVPRPDPGAALPAGRSDGTLRIERQIQARPKTAASKRRSKASHPVLRLSSPEPEASFGLKLATDLPAAPAVNDPQKAREIRSAQAHFAALLKDEDPLRDAEAQARSARERLQILQAEIDLLKERNRIDQAQLDELRKKPDLTFVLALLGILLAASAVAIVWLAMRWKAAQHSTAPKWWETVAPRQFDSPPAAAPAPPAPETPPAEFDERRPESHPARETDAVPRAEGRDGNYPFHAGAPVALAPVAPNRIEVAKVEEVSDVLQEVEFWTLLNDRARVLEILEPLAAAEETPDSPAPWLYLLDIYREMRQQDKYEALRERAMLFFNVNITHWEDLEQEGTARSLEDFPHLLQQICERWSRPGIIPFLESLLVDDRDGTREGFDLPVYREIMLLIRVAQELQKLPIPPATAAAA